MPTQVEYPQGPPGWQKGGLSRASDTEQAYGPSWMGTGNEPPVSNWTQGIASGNHDQWDLGQQPVKWQQPEAGDAYTVKEQEWGTPEQMEHRGWAHQGGNQYYPQNWTLSEEQSRDQIVEQPTDI